ncbi:ATP-binding protein [Actinomadura craniellae]|uniref:ATP-binding protein n=1 Tax=Actinomadura craniellae TaxID=2231787 RepID=A0A365H3I6_9ACTN|nr:ATP-binding protein [Actinomadura craniellae]RAY12783.1 ATP-binding protein [Actinomadura craniellae]
MSSRPLRVRLAPVPASVGMARDRTRNHLVSLGCPHLVENAVLVVSELVSNAVRKSPPDRAVEVRVYLDGGKPLIQVEDCSPEAPRRQDPTENDLSGRGLRIVEALSSECGYHPTPTGKVVWARCL